MKTRFSDAFSEKRVFLNFTSPYSRDVFSRRSDTRSVLCTIPHMGYYALFLFIFTKNRYLFLYVVKNFWKFFVYFPCKAKESTILPPEGVMRCENPFQISSPGEAYGTAQKTVKYKNQRGGGARGRLEYRAET